MADIRTYQGHSPKLGERVFVDRSAVVIGDVELGDDCSVWPLAVIRGDMHHIRIGARTSVQDGAVLHITHASDYNPGGYPLIIGDDVTIGHPGHAARLHHRQPRINRHEIHDHGRRHRRRRSDRRRRCGGNPGQTSGKRLFIRRQPRQTGAPHHRKRTQLFLLMVRAIMCG